MAGTENRSPTIERISEETYPVLLHKPNTLHANRPISLAKKEQNLV